MPFIIDIIGYHFYQWFIIKYWITIRFKFYTVYTSLSALLYAKIMCFTIIPLL